MGPKSGAQTEGRTKTKERAGVKSRAGEKEGGKKQKRQYKDVFKITLMGIIVRLMQMKLPKTFSCIKKSVARKQLDTFDLSVMVCHPLALPGLPGQCQLFIMLEGDLHFSRWICPGI